MIRECNHVPTDERACDACYEGLLKIKRASEAVLRSLKLIQVNSNEEAALDLAIYSYEHKLIKPKAK